MLKFITCGSVDDGKSTLVGRLLYDANLLTSDQLETLLEDSKNSASKDNPERLDFSLFTDGLQAEQEQGITIDVSYRFFETEKKKFIIADCPGHIQYTRNMATAASNTQVAVILIDARKGVIEQTKRHFFINYLFGIKNFVIVVNKMDLVNYEEKVFEEIKTDFLAFCSKKTDNEEIDFHFLPISAVKGDNVVNASQKMAYYKGLPLLSRLENIQIDEHLEERKFVLGVKYVARPNSDFRGFKGKVSAGTISVGEVIKVLGRDISSKVKEIFVDEKSVNQAQSGDIVCLTLEDKIDISRGDFLVSPQINKKTVDKFNADLIWLDHQEFDTNKDYLIRFYNNDSSTVSITPKFTYKIDTLEHEDFTDFGLNHIGNFDVEISHPTALTNYQTNQELGSFILIDRISNFTVGAGMIRNHLNKKSFSNSNAKLVNIKDQKPCWVNVYGDNAKSCAKKLEKALYEYNKHCFMLEEKDFSDEVLAVLLQAGLIVITHDKRHKNEPTKAKNFIEVYSSSDLSSSLDKILEAIN